MSKVTLQGDPKGFVAALQRVNKELDKTERAFGDSAKESKRAAREAQRIKESIDPWARFNRKVLRAVELTKKKLLTDEELQKKSRQYYREALRDQERLNNAMGGKGRRGGLFGSVFGPGSLGGKFINSMVTQLAALTASAAGFATIIRQVSSYFEDIDQRAKSVVSTMTPALGAIGSLSQVSGSPQEMQRNVREAYGLMGRGIFTDPSTAGRGVFGQISGGFTQRDRRDFARALQARFFNPENAGSTAASAALLMGRGRNRMSFQQVANMAQAFAKPIQGTIEQMMFIMAQQRQVAASFGVNRQTLGGFATAIGTQFQAQRIEPRLAQFLAKAGPSGILQRGPSGEVDYEKTVNLLRTMNREQLEAIFTERRAMEGVLAIIDGMETGLKAIEDSKAFVALDNVTKSLQNIEKLPLLRNLIRLEESRALTATYDRLMFGEKQAQMDRYMTAIRRDPSLNNVQKWTYGFQGWFYDYWGAEDWFLQQQAASGVNRVMRNNSQLSQDIINRQVSGRIDENLEIASSEERLRAYVYGREEAQAAQDAAPLGADPQGMRGN